MLHVFEHDRQVVVLPGRVWDPHEAHLLHAQRRELAHDALLVLALRLHVLSRLGTEEELVRVFGHSRTHTSTHMHMRK